MYGVSPAAMQGWNG